MNNLFDIQVRTLSGIERNLANELQELGLIEVSCKSHTVLGKGNLATLYRLNLGSRMAIRVLVPIRQSVVKNEKDIYQATKEIPWPKWLSPSGTLAVDAITRSSFMTHSLYLAQLTKDAIVDQFREHTGNRPSVELRNPDLRISVSLFKNQFQIALDSSGNSLHKRGYRQEAGDAPINEVLASGLVELSHWDESSLFFDPMCGSGTIVIEAALAVKNTPPGIFRQQFGFQKWKDYDHKLFETEKLNAKAHEKNNTELNNLKIIGWDVCPKMIAVAKANAERAKVSKLIHFEVADFFSKTIKHSQKGTIVTNPPYNKRMVVTRPADLTSKIGTRLKSNFGGWSAYILSGSPKESQRYGLKSQRKTTLFNGPIPCQFFEFQIDENQKVNPPINNTSSLANHHSVENHIEIFTNRLKKNLKHQGQWAKNKAITSYRVYDRDIPELPFILDIYHDKLHFAEIPRNHNRTEIEHALYVKKMSYAAAETLGIGKANIFIKKRTSKKLPPLHSINWNNYFEILEDKQKFLVNMSDFIETGLSLEYRKLRAFIKSKAKGKNFIHLFSQTGTLSVAASAGGAKSTIAVENSSLNQEWAQRNMLLNGYSGPRHSFVRSDAVEFINLKIKSGFDICVLSPPNLFTHRATGEQFEVQRDAPPVMKKILRALPAKGILIFVTRLKDFTLDEEDLQSERRLKIENLTSSLSSPDFKRHFSFQCWSITCL